MAIIPDPARAQAWPAVTVASVPALSPQSRMVPPRADTLKVAGGNAARRAATGPALNLNSRSALMTQVDDTVEVDIRAKSEWSDDQGLRVSPTRVAFKRRF